MCDFKIIYGVIGKDGEKLSGQGFTCKRQAKGKYQIKFTTHFTQGPAITATAEHAEESHRKVLNLIIDKERKNNREDGFVILIQEPNGEANDNRFHFIAVADQN